MGLDTSHDCWHGPYTAFMRWRQHLNYFIMRDRAPSDEEAQAISHMGTAHDAINRAWSSGMYEDQSIPLNVLMNHSDCDGDIPWDVCDALADALQALADKYMPARALYDETRPATERFIAGLRAAAVAGEPVEFH